MKIFLLFFFAVMTVSVFGQKPVSASPAGDVVFNDPQFPFSISYPKSWKQVVRLNSSSRLAAISENGTGNANFSLRAGPLDGSEELSAASYAGQLLKDPKTAETIAKNNMPDATVISAKQGQLGKNAALELIFEGDYKFVDSKIPMKIYLLQTLAEGNVYTIAFACQKAEFDKYYPAFKAIAATFVVKPWSGAPAK